jgi:hypothetical protein
MKSYRNSKLSLIEDYLELYKRCFYKYNKNLEYLEWLYVNNPMGSYLGVDVFDENKLVGQLGGIPINLKFYDKHIKTLVLLNTCIDKKYRGGRLFYNLAKHLEKTLIEKDYELLIGIGNKIATPAWIRSIKLRYLCQLQTFIGLYDFSKIQNLNYNYNIFTDWNDELANWRCSNPINKTSIVNFQNQQFIYSKTSFPFVKIYSPLLFNNISKNNIKREKNNINLKVFIGLSNEIDKSFFFREIPEYFKPSPLNFLYKFLKKDYHIKQNEIFFSYLDFDAF